MELKGKVALVTGGSGGIGSAIVRDLVREGVRVMAASNVQADLNALQGEIEAMGGTIRCFCADLTDRDNLKALVDETVKAFGTVNILVNNAGIFIQKPFLEMPLEDWDLSFDINVRAQFILDQLVLDIMKEHRDGYIINISSSIVFYFAEGDRAPYFSSKMAVIGLSRALLNAAKPYGIKVTTIYPDRVRTPMAQTITWDGPEKPEDLKWEDPEDIAQGVLYVLQTSERCFVSDLYMRNWIK